jgi:hypothetical protein
MRPWHSPLFCLRIVRMHYILGWREYRSIYTWHLFLRREGRLIFNLIQYIPKLHIKKSKIKIHNILSRFFHRFLLQWLTSNIRAKVQSLRRSLRSTSKYWTYRNIHMAYARESTLEHGDRYSYLSRR